MPSPVLGIDLGTTNSVVAHADEARVRVLRDRDGHLLTPSTVSFSANGEVTVGHAARERRTQDSQHTVFSVKRLMGRPYRSPEVRRAAERLPFKLEEGPTGAAVVRMRDDTFSLPEISAFILKHLRDVAETQLGQPCANAVITVPANFNELQRMATRDAGRIAGLNVLRILNEPTAAALAYGYGARQSQRIAVYDFGGGTFDISILELSGDVIEVVATAGDTQLGGDDIDRAIADRMLVQFQAQHHLDLQQHVQPYERLVLAAEWLKCQLSERELAEATIKRLVIHDGNKLDLRFQLSRSEFGELCAPLIGRTFSICEEALKLAGIRPTQLDAVLLVGGQTRTPQVRAMVREFFGMEPKSSVDPDLAVAHGAALQGYALSGVPASDLDRRGRAPSSVKSSPEADTTRPKRGTSSLYEERATNGPAEELLGTVDGTSDKDADEPEETTSLSRRPKGPLPAGQLPSLRPDKAPSLHARTLSGVGDPTSDRPTASDAVAVTSDIKPGPDARAREARELRETVDIRPMSAGRAPDYVVSRQRVHTQPLPPLSPPPIDFDSDLPPVLRNSELPPLELDEPDDDPTATLLDSPRAKERVQARSERPPERRPQSLQPSVPHKPTRLAMARSLATQGQHERALVVYAELLSDQPYNHQLQDEERAIRAQLASVRSRTRPQAPGATEGSQLLGAAGSKLPPAAPTPTGPGRGAKPPPPPPARSNRAATQQTRDLRPATLSSDPVHTNPPPASGTSQLLAVSSSFSAAPPSAASSRGLPSQFPAPPMITPLLLDVTPHTLCVETTGGFCERIIERNAPIPTEQTRIFTTSRDQQTTVSVRVCQGESRSMDDNQVLGHIELLDLRSGRSGEVSIAVTFVIDVDGTLNVRAIDEATGRGQELRVNLTGAIDDEELERMRKKAHVLAS